MMYKEKDKSQDDGKKSYLKRVSMGLYVYLYSIGILKFFFLCLSDLFYFGGKEKKGFPTTIQSF